MKNEILSNLKNILSQEKNLESELYVSSGRTQEISLKEGVLENVDFSSYEGMGLRIFKDDKSAFAYSNAVNEQELKALFAKTKDIIKFAQPDKAHKIPEIKPQENRPGLDIFDKDVFKPETAEVIELLSRESANALKTDQRIKKVIRAGCSQSEGITSIMNSAGIILSESSTAASFGISVLAESSGDTQIGSSHTAKRFFKDMDIKFATNEASQMSCAMLNAGKISSGKRSIIMHPSVAVEFMGLIADVLSADAIQKKRSFLSGSLGSKAASESFTLVDDPLLPRGMSSSVFDDEGVETGKIEVFAKGILKNIFYDSYTACKDGKKSSGNAFRGSFSGLPSPGASNLYIQQGNKSLEKLLSGISSGVYVLDVMGMHMADTISGDFSVGVSGLRIENGSLSKPVRGLTLAGNLRQFLSNIKEAGNDIIFYGGFGAPSILIEDLMIGG